MGCGLKHPPAPPNWLCEQARLLRLRFSQDLVRLNEAVCRCKCGSREIEQAWSQAFVCLVLRVLDVVAVHEIPGLV